MISGVWSRESVSLRRVVESKPFARPKGTRAQANSPRIAVNPLLLYGGFALLLATNALTLVGFLMSSDVTRLVGGQDQTVLVAYENRIAQLRVEVDRLQSRHYAQAGDINLQLQDLAHTQELLLEQHQYVKQLASRAAELGIEAVASQPETAPVPLRIGAVSDSPADQVAAAVGNVSRMMEDSRLALAALSEEANSKTEQLMDTLAGIGIRPKLPNFGVGGPLLAPVEGSSSSVVDDANEVAEALERFRVAREEVNRAPIHRPTTAAVRTSSTFGNRKDPFTGRLAFHSGLDFAAANGSKVLAAGAGTVTFVGKMSGYGNVVEITHASGLVSRYAHLSAFIVKKGDTVAVGTPIARVGSTGRSTGPHLHFEVRRSDKPLDPVRYLNTGKSVARILGG
jgi:murein DD-endopeptidase MepM/ murein hydrolase activator NlpD